MLPVGVVQVALYEIIHMVSVRHALMSAAFTMNVIGLMRVTVMVRRTLLWICGIACHLVLIHVALLGVVQVPIVQIIRMALVPNGGVATIRAMDVHMFLVFVAISRHIFVPPGHRHRFFSAWPISHPVINRGRLACLLYIDHTAVLFYTLQFNQRSIPR